MGRRPQKVKGISPRQDSGRSTWRIHFCIRGETWSEPYATEQECRDDAAEFGRRHLKGEDIRPQRLRQKTAPAPVPTEGTLRWFYKGWIVKPQRGRATGTNGQYARIFKHHVLEAQAPTDDPTAPLAWEGMLGDVLVSDATFTRDLCIEFARSLIGRRGDHGRALKHSYRESIVLALSAFLGWARDQKHIPLSINPAEKLLPHVVNKQELARKVEVWDHVELQRFLDTVKKHQPEWYAFFFFAAWTGLRIGELIELRWTDFDDWNPRTHTVGDLVHVQRQYLIRKGSDFSIEGDELLEEKIVTDEGRISPTKGRKNRAVPLEDDVRAMLQQHWTAEQARALKLGAKRGHKLDLVFTGNRGGRVSPSRVASELLPKLCALAKVPTTGSIHRLRHTYASILLAHGTLLGDVSRWLGHQSEALTERTYRHFIKDVRRVAELKAQIKSAFGGRARG